MKTTGIGVLIVALVALVRLVVWLAPNLWESPSHSPITVDGSTTMYPLMAAIVQQFQRSTGTVRMTVGLARPDGGFEKFCHGETAIHGVSRPITDEERQTCAGRGVQYYEFPVALDAIAIVVNAENHWAHSMTLEDLKTAWEPAAHGRVRRWQDVRSDWPDAPLTLVAAGADSGMFDYFTEAVVGEARKSRADYTATEDDTSVGAAVAADRHALGYVPYAYFESNRKNLRALAVGSPPSPVSPASETIENGTYPLVRPVFVYVNRSAAERAEVRALVDYSLQHAGPLTPHANLSPLPERAYAMVRERFEYRKLGTAYRGESVAQLRIEEVLAREPRL